VCIAALKSPAARDRTFELYSAPSASPEMDWDAAFRKLAPDQVQP
jgi:hypothetical protein